MGKVYGKNASGSTQLIIDGDAIDQRLSTLEANWDSISLIKTVMITDGITLYVLGKLAIIIFHDITANYEWGWTTVATLEEQYRPSARYKSSLKGERSNGDGVFYSVPVQLNTNGTLQLNPGSNAKLHIDGELVYFMG